VLKKVAAHKENSPDVANPSKNGRMFRKTKTHASGTGGHVTLLAPKVFTGDMETAYQNEDTF